jgi:hypothetical protein
MSLSFGHLEDIFTKKTRPDDVRSSIALRTGKA